MRFLAFFCPLFCVLAAEPVTAQATRPFTELADERIDQISAMLPAMPRGLARPITDRAYWNAEGTRARFHDLVATAEKYLSEPLPPWDADAYLEYSRKGERVRGDAMIGARYGRLGPLVIVECMEDKGRFLPRIRELLQGATADPTWTMPAHDGDLTSFNGTRYHVDLGASGLAAELAEAVSALGDRLDPQLRADVAAAIDKRVFSPFRDSLAGVDVPGQWWLGSKAQPASNNWNAVCLNGIVGAALAIIPDRRERAVFAAAGEHYSTYFLNGLRASGYCDEGAGYWSYGFGAFVNLREALVAATDGSIDLFDSPRARAAALFGQRYQLTDHLLPTFADSKWDTHANQPLIDFVALTFGMPADPAVAQLSPTRLHSCMREPTPWKNTAQLPLAGKDAFPALRSYFDDVGVLISRPSPGGESQLALAVKAGGNSHHSHNDIGSYAITLASAMPLADPGGPAHYDARTFTADRYTRKIFSSFGHPVPVIGGRLQADAPSVKIKVLSTSFTDDADEITIDLTPAYPVPELGSLTRTFRYARTGKGQITITDRYTLTADLPIEEALTTHGSIESVSATEHVFQDANQSLRVQIKSPTPANPQLKTEVIEDLGLRFTRLGLTFQSPGRTGGIVMTVTPR